MRHALRALVALLALFWAGDAWAGAETNYSGLTSMTFQNGVAPTADYAGITDSFISGNQVTTDSTTVNYGTNNYLRVSGASGLVPLGPFSTVIGFDFSALPDSAIIYRARLYLFQKSQVTSANDPRIWPYRLNRPFNESQVTWVLRQTGTNWVGAGASTVESQSVGGTWQTASTDSAVASTNFVGSDTLSTGSVFDTPSDPIVVRSTKAGTAGGNQGLKQTGWVTFDITNLVRQGVNGSAATVQCVLHGDVEQAGATGTLWFYSSNWSGSAAALAHRPKVIVEYSDPTGSSSGSGRRVMGAGGAGVQ